MKGRGVKPLAETLPGQQIKVVFQRPFNAVVQRKYDGIAVKIFKGVIRVYFL